MRFQSLSAQSSKKVQYNIFFNISNTAWLLYPKIFGNIDNLVLNLLKLIFYFYWILHDDIEIDSLS